MCYNWRDCMMADACWLVTTFVVCSITAIDALLINRPTDLYSRYEDDGLVVEWDILSANYEPFLGETYLNLRKDAKLLFVVHLFDGNFDLSEADKSIYRVNFSNSRRGRFGVVLSEMRLDEAGIYSCSYRDTNDTTVENGKSSIIVFVFAQPEKPIIHASGPMTTGRDVTLACVTQSHSEPAGNRPEMTVTWYRDGGMLKPNSHDGATVVGDRLELSNLVGSRIHHYNCSVRETGSRLVQYSNAFPVVLLALEPISADVRDARQGDDVTLTWRLYPTSEIPPLYNRTVSFTRNAKPIASWNVQYIQWTSLVDRMTYYNPAADQHGFKLHGLLPGDIGHYACVYQDEFGTVVTSEIISLGLQGFTLPPYVTQPVVLETSSEAASSVVPQTLGSTNGKDVQTMSGVTQAIIISGVLGVAVLILVITLVAYIVKRRRKTKEPASLLRPRVPPEETVRYRNPGSVVSIYSTLRESLMVSDDVIAQSPSLPPRDDTYNQPFEDSRQPLAADDIEDSYLTPLGCTETLKENSYCNNDDVTNTKLCNNQQSGERHQENVYLAPVRQSEQRTKPEAAKA